MFPSKVLPLPIKSLPWFESGGNPSNTELKFISKGDLVYGISGKYWKDSSSKPPSDKTYCSE